jgi:DNA repair exonuclease SbcCD ATPase subunit
MVIHDFKAFRGKHALALNGTGVVYVEGENRVTGALDSNGASKSTLWDALCWCLYGRTTKGLRNPDVKPWKTGGKTSVTVLLVVDGQDFSCQRTTSPKHLFTINGAEHAEVGGVLPISYDLFVNAIVLPQGRELFLDRGPSDKMKLVSDACGMERWDTRSAIAAKRAEALDKEAAGYAIELSSTEGALAELGRSIETARHQSVEWNDQAMARQQVSKAELTRLERDLEAKQRDLDDADLREETALTELRAAERALEDARRAAVVFMGNLSRVKSELDVLNRQVDGWERDLDELSRSRTCPTCGQAVKASNLASHKQELREKVKAASLRISAELKKRAGYDADGAALQARMTAKEAEMVTYRAEAESANDVITRYRPAVAELKQQIAAAKRVKDEVNPHLATISDLNKRKRKLQTTLSEIREDIELVQARAERARWWVKGFKDIKLQLIDDVMRDLELTANGTIEEVGLTNWEMQFDVEKESKNGNVQRLINVGISSPESDGVVKWDSWSGGEQQRLKLIGSLALSDVLLAQVGVETNLEVLDEPAMYWSAGGVQDLCAFLATRAKEREKTIFYIEHNTVQSTYFSEVVKVIKTDKGAYIEGGNV